MGTVHENKELIRAFFEQVWNKGNFGYLDEVYSDDFQLNELWQDTAQPGSGTAAKQEVLDSIKRWQEAFPDMHVTLEEQIGEGEFVATRHVAEGTQAKEFMGLPNTGKSGAISGITISRIRGGRVTEEWTCWDAVGLMQQLGILPSGAGDELLPDVRPVFAAQALLPAGSDTNEQAKAVVQRFYREVWNAGRLELVDEMFTPHFVGHAPGGELSRGPRPVQEFVADWQSVVPDVQIEVHAQVAEGARIATRFTGRGTHLGSWNGIPPTGKQITLSGISITRVINGKFVSEWGEFDVMGLLQQLGVIEQSNPD